MKTKDVELKGIPVLIKALRDSHEGAGRIAQLFESWDSDQEISNSDIETLEKWLKEAKCDDSRKIARCIVKCIYNNLVTC